MQARIRSYRFELSEPYQPGPTTLTLAEAQVLNAARAGYLRDKIERRVRTAERKAGGLLDTGTLTKLQATVRDLDASFEFAPRSAEPQISDLELQVEIVAEERVEAMARADNLTLTGAERERAVAELRDHEYVQAEARRRVAAKRETALEALL